MSTDCLFCKIVAGEVPATIVYQDKDVVAFNDINPVTPVHILFVPRKHIASMAALTPEDGPVLTSLFLAAKKVAHDMNLDQGYRFIANTGPHAGQSVMHLHFHLLGGRELGWPSI